MNAILIYLLKVNIAIALFYGFYKLFFSKDTFLKIRRVYLLASLVLSFGYPFLSIQNWLSHQPPVQNFIAGYTQLPEIIVTPTGPVSIFSVGNILLFVYLLVFTFLLVRVLFQLISILRMKFGGKCALIKNVKVTLIEQETTPFSFFGAIFLQPSLHTDEEIQQILTHEMTHVRQLHSLDVLIFELLTTVFWFNPFVWLLKREVRQNLEFLADNQVLESGFDCKTYQYNLLQLAYQSPELKLANKFNISPLKNRIIMMNKQKSQKAGLLKYLLIVPLALALVVSSNAETLISSAKKDLQQKEPKTEAKSANKLDGLVVVGYAPTKPTVSPKPVPPPPPVPPVADKQNDPVFQVVEKMPEFPGGQQAMFKYLAENVKYPKVAQEKGIQGRVICQFIVGKEGKVRDVKVIRSVDPELDAEAIRVIRVMPVWTPGEQRGKKVSVQFVLPISFKLDGDKGTTPKISATIVVDGEKMPADFNLNTIKPAEIEKINVIKPSTDKEKKELIAKYGPEAANGVIEITKKK